MTAFGTISIPLLLMLFSCLSQCYAAETVVVDKAFNGREIKVRAGGFIRLELEQLGSAGYAWAVRDLDREHFEVLSDQIKDIPAKGEMTGAPVVRTWLISVKKKGKAGLRFLHYRPWEGENNASDTFVLKVRIL
jgi:predicted secreted protein